MAVAMVALAAVATMAAYGAELRALSRAAEVSAATALAEDRLTTVTLLAGGELPHLPDSLRRGRFGNAFPEYAWTAEAEELPGHNLVELTVSVSLPTGSHEIVTLLSPPGSRRDTP